MAPPHALPLPIAALLRRARNATDPTRRHLAAYYAWEASLRLTVAAEPPEDVSSLAMPSVGHFVKAMPPRPGSLTDPALLALHALLAEVGTEQRSAPRSTTAPKLLALLPAYRNKVIGHGSTRTDAFNEGAARAFLEALEPAWRLGVFLPPGATLLFVDQVEIKAGGARRARLVRLEGLASEREGAAPVGEEVRPERVYLRKDGQFASLHPWVLFEGGEERERVLFFNGYRNAAEYLDYGTGEIVKSKALAAAFPALDAEVTATLRQERGERAAQAAPSPAKAKEEAARRPGLWRPVAAALALLSLGVGGAVYWKSRAGGQTDKPIASAAPVAAPLVPTISEDAAVQAEFRRGIESLLQADIYAAENALQVARDRAPREPWPHAALAMVSGLEGHYEDSQREMDEAIALTRGKAGRDAELMAVIDRAIDPDYAASMRAWGELEARHGKWLLGRVLVAYYYSGKGPAEEQIARFDGVLGIEDRHALVYLLKSRTQTNLGKLPEALETVRAGLERYPAAPWLIAQRGTVRMLLGQPREARADLEDAVARKGPFNAHVLYAMTLLGTGQAEDEAQFEREAEALRSTKNVDDRLSFMCALAMGLLRQGRAKEADRLLDGASALAAAKGKQGTLVRCVLWPVWGDIVLGRFDHAEATFQKLGRIWEGFGLTKGDEAHGKTLLKLLKGTVAAERGDVATAEAELAELERNGKKTGELGYRIAIARKQEVEVPDLPAGQSLLLGALRVHTQARALEVAGKLAEAEATYGKVVALRDACSRSISDGDLLCGVVVADALVRRAALEARRGAAGDAARTLDALAAFWPRPDPDLPLVKRAAEIRKSLPPAGGR